MTLKWNLVGNLSGSIWQTAMNLAFIPIYINYLGVGAYGLIGFFITLQTLIAVLDFGMSSTSIREFARLSTDDNLYQTMGNFFKTMEYVFWGMSLIIFISLITLTFIYSDKWFTSANITPETIRNTLILMCIALGIQWPSSLYVGIITGLEKHIALNVINSFFATLRGIGAVAILLLVSPTLQAFFVWQIIVNIISTLTLVLYVRQCLPKQATPKRFVLATLLPIKNFAGGISAISFASIIIGQFDKIILSKILSLEDFGYYAFASLIAMSLNRFFTPIFNTAYPRLGYLIKSGREKELVATFHQLSQYMTILIAPMAIIIALFSYEIVNIWTANATIAKNTASIISILVAGVFFNGLLNIPYALQLAHGWTALNLKLNLIAGVTVVPLVIFLTSIVGAEGAAIAWLLVNIFFFISMPILMHKKLLPRELTSWVRNDILIPIIPALIIVVIAKWLIPDSLTRIASICYILSIFGLSLLATICSTVEGRLLIVKAKAQIFNY